MNELLAGKYKGLRSFAAESIAPEREPEPEHGLSLNLNLTPDP